MTIKVTITWGYLHVPILNANCHSNMCYSFIYQVCTKRIIVYVIDFICMDDVPWYLDAILVRNLIHSRLHLIDHFIFLIQIEWGPPYESQFIYQLVILHIIFSVDSV